MDSRENFDKSIGNIKIINDEGISEIESVVFHENYMEENFINEIFSGMAWNG